MGFSVPRTQAKAVRGVKDKKAGKNSFCQRLLLDHLLTECKQTSVSQRLTDSPQASALSPCCAGFAMRHTVGTLLRKNHLLILRHISQVPHFTCSSTQAFPNYPPQPGPARSGLSSPSPSSNKTSTSRAETHHLWQTLRKSMGLGMTAARDFPCHGKSQHVEQPLCCFCLASPIPKSLQGQFARSSERPDLVGVSPVHGRTR